MPCCWLGVGAKRPGAVGLVSPWRNPAPGRSSRAVVSGHVGTSPDFGGPRGWVGFSPCCARPPGEPGSLRRAWGVHPCCRGMWQRGLAACMAPDVSGATERARGPWVMRSGLCPFLLLTRAPCCSEMLRPALRKGKGCCRNAPTRVEGGRGEGKKGGEMSPRPGSEHKALGCV